MGGRKVVHVIEHQSASESMLTHLLLRTDDLPNQAGHSVQDSSDHVRPKRP